MVMARMLFAVFDAGGGGDPDDGDEGLTSGAPTAGVGTRKESP